LIVSKKTLSSIIILIIAAVGFAALFYFQSKQQAPAYSGSRTAYAVMAQENPAFAQADAAFQQKDYTQAEQQYQTALANAQDQTQKNLAS